MTGEEELPIQVVGFKVLTAVKIQVEVFWVMMPCSFVVVYQCFGRLRCFHLEMEMEAARSFTS